MLYLTKFMHVVTTLNTNMQKEPISLISDASVQKNKQSGFAWVISHHTQPLWKGIGLTLGQASDMYSGRAEAFGLLTGLTFLQYYISCYRLDSFTASPLQCFCNNKGIITNMTALLSPHILQPNAMTNDNHNVYLAISKMAKQCAPMQPHFLHVKGHQDKDPNHPLTVIEAYNVDCNTGAKKYTCEAPQSSTMLSNPAIPVAQPHLKIAGKIICCKTMETI